MVELVAERCVVEQPAPLDLRDGHCGEPAPIHLIEDAVVEHSGAMKDAPQGRHIRTNLAQNPAEFSLVCDVADGDNRADPFCLESPDSLRCFTLRPAAASKHESARTAAHHPLRYLQTKRTKAAGD